MLNRDEIRRLLDTGIVPYYVKTRGLVVAQADVEALAESHVEALDRIADLEGHRETQSATIQEALWGLARYHRTAAKQDAAIDVLRGSLTAASGRANRSENECFRLKVDLQRAWARSDGYRDAIRERDAEIERLKAILAGTESYLGQGSQAAEDLRKAGSEGVLNSVDTIGRSVEAGAAKYAPAGSCSAQFCGRLSCNAIGKCLFPDD